MRTLSGSRSGRGVVWYLCVAIVVMSCVPGSSVAAPLPPETPQRREDLAKLQPLLELRLVRQRLAELGMTEAEALRGLARLDDQELHELAQRLDEVGAGGNAVESILLGLSLVFLVVIPLIILFLCYAGGGECRPVRDWQHNCWLRGRC